MTAEQFDAASEQERNEAVALALGWTEITFRKNGPPTGKPPSPRHELAYGPILNWSGDDGLAFKELWPEIVKIRSEVRLGMILKTPKCFLEPSSDYSGKISSFLTDLSGSSNTWANAICKAFLALKESNAHQG